MASLREWYNCCGARIMHSVANTKPTKKEFDALLAAKSTAAVFVFIDNAQKSLISSLNEDKSKYIQDTVASNGGDNWAKFIRAQGYRVDEIWLGGNPNHQELDPHKLTMYIWYLNSQKDKESVYVREQPKKPILPRVPDAVKDFLDVFGRGRSATGR